MISRHCSGVVLAGGASSRFGGKAKGLVQLGGRRIIDFVLDALRNVTDELLLIANDPMVRASVPGVRAFGDVREERGSLVGVHSALARIKDGALVVAWDTPFLSPDLLAAIRRAGERNGVAAIPEGPRGLEPLCAYYSRACLTVAERQIEIGEMRLSEFVAALPRRAILSRNEVARYGAPERLFANINSAADLAAAEGDHRATNAREPASPLERT